MIMMMMMMKIEPEIVLPYEDLPDSSKDLVKSLKNNSRYDKILWNND